jgi:hypothetical protein
MPVQPAMPISNISIGEGPVPRPPSLPGASITMACPDPLSPTN